MRHADLSFTPVWSDSLGAKTTCCYVETPDLSICVDPGVAAMQPSYPLSAAEKARREREARREIERAASRADHVAISHYHYDHYLPDPSLYRDAELWLKDPNRWINDSQRERAGEFLAALAADRGVELTETPPRQRAFDDPLSDLPHATGKDFGGYQARREELLETWRGRFRGRAERWATEPWVEEPPFARFADGRSFERGGTRVRFHGPLFHGIEYASTGWVFATVVETPEAKFVHSSDLEGPVVEDYADWLVEEDPDLVFLDGPATYLLGYVVNRTNLRRSVDNARRIVREAEPELLVWDHHLLRDRRYRERTSSFWELASEGYDVRTVAELRGVDPLVDRLSESDGGA
ncbi:MBL fold metallo-hydrolase [Halegenticoccus soli]|uniref:MBL fold metallo-hydrolase n=1 Tax=Halegenticoccus soli TaxID=1985678 RepID=UPI00117B358B|nr:MBL fold metallo-hydrolase [Halegenticoccus soli]